MNSIEFVDAIRDFVWKPTLDSLNTLLIKPPGRSPRKDLVEKSVWYNSLGDKDKDMVLKIIDESARIAVFNFLCVLDGVKVIEAGGAGDLKLYYEKDGEKVLLNDMNLGSLHDLL